MPAEQDRFQAYAELVHFWAPRIDLIAPGDLPRFEERHIDDCLRAVPLLESLPPGPAVDVGSGAGLPGVPLAISDPTRQWRLLEPRSMRAAFLEEAVRSLALNCDVLRLTAEQAARDPALKSSHVLATARALRPPARAFAMLQPLVASGGVSLVFVGETGEIPPEAEEWRPGMAIIRSTEPPKR